MTYKINNVTKCEIKVSQLNLIAPGSNFLLEKSCSTKRLKK